MGACVIGLALALYRATVVQHFLQDSVSGYEDFNVLLDR